MLRNSTDLPLPDPPTTARIFALVQIQIEVLVHALTAEAITQTTDFDHRLGGRSG